MSSIQTVLGGYTYLIYNDLRQIIFYDSVQKRDIVLCVHRKIIYYSKTNISSFENLILIFEWQFTKLDNAVRYEQWCEFINKWLIIITLFRLTRTVAAAQPRKAKT